MTLEKVSKPSRRAAISCAAVLVIVVIVLFCRQLFLGQTLVPLDILYLLSPWINLHAGAAQNHIVADAVREGYPWMFYASEWLSRGVIAWWNPLIFSGIPVPASFFPVFFPLTLLFLIFPTLDAYSYIIMLQVLLVGLFMFMFLRERALSYAAALAGAITLMLSQVIIHWSENFQNTSSMLWLPLELFLATRLFRTKKIQYAGLLSIVLAANVFGGQFQFLYYSMIMFGAYCLFLFYSGYREGDSGRELGLKASLFAAAGAISIGIALVQLVPTLQFTQYVARTGETAGFVAHSVFHWRQIVTFIVPNFFGNPVAQSSRYLNLEWFMDSAYIGVLPLILAIVGAIFSKKKGRLFFVGAAVATCVLMFLPATNKILYYAAPLYSRFRNVPRWVFIYSFSMSVLAAYGLDALAGPERIASGKRKGIFLAVAALCFGFVSTAALAYWRLITSNPGMPQALKSYVAGQAWLFIAILFVSIVALIIAATRRAENKLAPYVLVAVIAVDVLVMGFSFYPAVDKSESYPAMPGIEYLMKDKSAYRVIRYEGRGAGAVPSYLSPTLTPNTLMVYGIQDAQGSCPFMLKRYADFMNIIEDHGKFAAKKNQIPSIQQAKTVGSPLLDLLNVKYFLSVIPIKNTDVSSVYDSEIKIYRNKDVLPRAFVVYDWEKGDNDAELKKLMMAPGFDPSGTAVIEKEAPVKPAKDQARTEAKIISYGPNEVTVKATTETSGLLILSDVYYPGWSVEIDGQAAELYRTDYIFRGVFLKKGAHTVRFTYQPSGFKASASVSGLALITALTLIGAGILTGRKVRTDA